MLQWLRANKCPWGTSTCYEAAVGGHLDILKWVRSAEKEANKCPWNSRVCHGAAHAGHLDILKWARSPPGGDDADKCPWDEDVTRWAVLGGHLDVLEWAWENGCPMKPGLKTVAVESGHMHLESWLTEWEDAEDKKANVEAA